MNQPGACGYRSQSPETLNLCKHAVAIESYQNFSLLYVLCYGGAEEMHNTPQTQSTATEIH